MPESLVQQWGLQPQAEYAAAEPVAAFAVLVRPRELALSERRPCAQPVRLPLALEYVLTENVPAQGCWTQPERWSSVLAVQVQA